MRFGFSAFIEEDEKIEKVFRRSLFLVLGNIIKKTLIWGTITYVIWFFYPKYNELDLSYIWKAFAAIGVFQIISVILHWYYNSILLTNESVTFIYWDHLFHRTHSRIDFPNLDSIEIEKKGFRSFLGNFGNVYFHKVGGGESVMVPRVGNPKRMVRKIEAWKEHILSRHNFSEESALKGLLSNMVKTHIGSNEYSHEEVIDRFHNKTSEELFESDHDKNKTKKEPKPEEHNHFSKQRDDHRHNRTSESYEEPPTTKPTNNNSPSKNLSGVDVEKRFDNEGGISIDLDLD